jgi:transcription antitermination factor NusB
MRKRTYAREFALQILYQIDITEDDTEAVLENFWQNKIDEKIDPSIKDFTDRIVRGVVGNLDKINAKITQYAKNWQLKRMAVVDRNILRLASFELLFCQDIPPKVSINEAVELSKKFSGIETAKFVNGILDKIKLEINK